ncbi:MAG: methyl-accepting chemotaxis protein [Endomicrobia bacterium]|nr:methyl-accepting chemotaxis protein [Endomicrobiia bacterium]
MRLKNIFTISRLFRRRKYVINPYLQFKYLIIVVILVVIVLFVSTYFVNLTMATTPILVELTELELAAVGRVVFKTVLYVSIAFIVIIIVLGIFISHRIAGPLYVFHKMFDLVSNGDLTIKLKLRKGDELQDLAVSFQNMIDNLAQYVKTDREKIEEIKLEIDKIANMIMQGERKEVITQKMLEIKIMLDQLYQSFKI